MNFAYKKITLEHNGISLLDKLIDFKNTVFEVMRQESRIYILRTKLRVEYPATFMPSDGNEPLTII